MDIFEQKKWLIRLLFSVVVMNFILMYGLWQKCSTITSIHEASEKTEQAQLMLVLQQELELSEQQRLQLQQIRANFNSRERELARIIRAKRDSMNVEMFASSTRPESVQAFARGIAETELSMELLRYEQAEAFKAICTPAQLKKFDGLLKEIKRFFKPDNGKKKRYS